MNDEPLSAIRATGPAVGRWPGAIALALVLAVATALRLWHLDRQILLGDEFHALRVAVSTPLSKILVTYLAIDHSLPMTAAFRLWLAAGLPLTEWVLRAIPLLSGVLLVAVLPAMARRWGLLDASDTRAWSWLLAVSAPLVIYSRVARSYSPLILLTSLAALSLLRHLAARGATPRDAVRFGLFGGVALWFHLGAGPWLAAALFTGLLCLPPERRRRILWPAATLGAVAILLVGPAASTLDAVAGKSQPFSLDATAWPAALVLQSGTRFVAVAAAMGLLASLGLGRLWRSRPLVARFSLGLVAGHAALLWVLSPAGISAPLILNRYLLPATPWWLLWAAAGAATLASKWPPLARPAVGTAALVAYLGLGPLASYPFREGSFAHHAGAVGAWQGARQPEIAAPPIYERLAAAAPRGTVAEFPFTGTGGGLQAIALYQQRHRLPILAVAVDGYLTRPGVALRRIVPGRPASLLASEARFVLVHLDLNGEEAAVPGARERSLRRNTVNDEGRIFARRLANAWGPPTWEEGPFLAWDLDRVRRSPAGARQR